MTVREPKCNKMSRFPLVFSGSNSNFFLIELMFKYAITHFDRTSFLKWAEFLTSPECLILDKFDNVAITSFCLLRSDMWNDIWVINFRLSFKYKSARCFILWDTNFQVFKIVIISVTAKLVPVKLSLPPKISLQKSPLGLGLGLVLGLVRVRAIFRGAIFQEDWDLPQTF